MSAAPYKTAIRILNVIDHNIKLMKIIPVVSGNTLLYDNSSNSMNNHSWEVAFFQLINKFPNFYHSRSFIFCIHKNRYSVSINSQNISAYSLSPCFFTTPKPRPPKWLSPVLWLIYTMNVVLKVSCYTAGSSAEKFNFSFYTNLFFLLDR
jgi:hypothetical protein